MIYYDQLNRSIEIESVPQKIVSLVPSQTELLCDLGLENTICGITKFCVHPQHLKNAKTIVGGTKNLQIEKIKELHPHLIIANKEENEQAQILELAQDFPVYVSDVNSLETAFDMMRGISLILGTISKAENLISKIQIEKSKLHAEHGMSVVYLIWKDPWLTAGGDTFIHDMLESAGFTNVYAHINRYPEISLEDIQQKQPNLLFLSSEPYPFKESHALELQKLLPRTKVFCVDGEFFSWYGSRMQLAFPYFQALMRRISI